MQKIVVGSGSISHWHNATSLLQGLRCMALALLLGSSVGCSSDSSDVTAAAAQEKVAAKKSAAPADPHAGHDHGSAAHKALEKFEPAAAPEGGYVAGQHYEVLPNPADTFVPGKIEVMEAFWYGCGHCYSFEPIINVWKKTIADDVSFLRTPAMWDRGGVMKHHASVYYAAEALGVLEDVHPDVFDYLAKDKMSTNQDDFAEIFASHGVSREDFEKAFSAFGTRSKVAQAERRTKTNYRIQGTPEMIVNGKYRVSSRTAGGQVEMLSVVGYLVELERNR